MVSQPVETFFALYETQSSIATFTRTQVLSKLIRSHMNPVHKFPSYFFTINFSILLSTSRFTKLFLFLLWFSHSSIFHCNHPRIRSNPPPFISLYITHMIVQSVWEVYLPRAIKTIISIRAEVLHKLLEPSSFCFKYSVCFFHQYITPVFPAVLR